MGGSVSPSPRTAKISRFAQNDDTGVFDVFKSLSLLVTSSQSLPIPHSYMPKAMVK